MKFTESIKIKDKIFRKEDLLRMWECVSSNAKSELAGVATIRIENEDRQVTAQGSEIFETSNFKKEKVKSIHIDYRSSDWNSQINIQIENSSSILFNWSKITIEGGDEDWVLAYREKLRGIVSDVETISIFSRFYKYVGRWGVYVVFGCVAWGMFESLIVPLIKENVEAGLFRIVLAILYFAIGALGWWALCKIDDASYIVEIDVGGVRSRFRYKVLSVLWAILSAVILPILVSWYFSTRTQNMNLTRSGDTAASLQLREKK